MSEQKKATSLVISLLMMIGLGFGVLTAVQVFSLGQIAKSDSREDHVDSYNRLANAMNQAISNTVEGYFKDLQVYVGADVMRNGDIEEVGRWLQDRANLRAAEYDYIMIAGPDGLAYTDLGKRTDIAERDYFQAIVKQGQNRFIDNPVVSKTTGDKVIHVTTALKDAKGKTFAMVSGVINVENLIKPVKELDVPEGVWQFMLDHNGDVMYHPAAAEGGNFLTNPGEGHEDLIEYSRKMINGESGHAWIKSYTGSRQDLLVYSGIAGTPWALGFTVAGATIDALGSKVAVACTFFGVVVLAAILVLAAIILALSLKPLQTVRGIITDIATGNADLTKRIHVTSNNEIGQVVQGFNLFVQKLQNIVADVKASKDVLSIAGEDMGATAQDTATAITQIIANIESVHHQILTQSASVEETAGAVNQIASNIESLNRMIENQSAGVSQASAAVEEMIGNISSVNHSVDKMASSFDALRRDAQSGYSQQQEMNERIQQIEQQSAMLQDANAAISAIAEQTNLLAMNAAIEAAHAGEAGKGFSVVADEIRKLSETSTAQSKTIGDQLNNIKDSIQEVVSSSGQSSKAFDAVSRQIQDTDQLVMQIKAAMEEQNAGSRQINDALHSMNDSTIEVRNASAEMSAGNQAILEEIQRLQDATEAMKNSMDEMSTGARKINDTGAALSDISDQVKDSIDKIGKQIDQFKV